MSLILIVEDEPKIAELLQKYLQNAGYQTAWLTRGDAVAQWLTTQQPALIILDLMLPGKDGLEVCKEIRLTSQVPVIMLTARVEEIDRLLGLELGADDYICKPFSPREVVARIKAVLRRFEHQHQSGTGDATRLNDANQLTLALDRQRLTVSISQQEVSLTRVEFDLLNTLYAQPGRIFSRQQLMAQVYPDNRIVSDRTIDSHVKKLRKKITALTPEQELIHSVYSVGYKFEM